MLRQCSHRAFSTSPQPHADFDHVIIGAGAVGLAIARRLASRPSTSTLLIEKHASAGTETSSRNSEVIHAGLYYGHDSLKTKLCLQGKRMIYDLCAKHDIPHRNCKKWIVAQTEQQMGELEKLHSFAQSIGVPTRFLSREEAARREPDVRAQAGVLESESTGIVDGHALMSYLEGSFQSHANADTVYHTSVVSISHDPSRGEYTLTTTTPSAPPSDPYTTITTSTLINSAGLSAIPVSNMLLPPEHHLTPYYAKGTYYSYSAPHPAPSTLIYPAPKPGSPGLGTHLTLDLSSPPRIRFGPDVEWTDSPTDYAPTSSGLAAALDEIAEYLPGVRREKVHVDYCGIRPKLGKAGAVGGGKGFLDFVIREEAGKGFGGFVNLLGIESPGLTSCLAIGEMVEGLLYR
ncbi:hypothetical protein MMC14_009458 [Varicellaria rhodocarpa]|nr:hypothetical protein [Varicellaria rhodocarpa]